MLRDAPGLAGGHLAPPQTVQQGGFPMIHVAHDGDHRRAGLQQGRVSWRSGTGQRNHQIKGTVRSKAAALPPDWTAWAVMSPRGLMDSWVTAHPE